MKMNKKLRRILLTVCSAALLVCVTVGATVAYLTSTDAVTNTFTVGRLSIELDETDVNVDGVKDGEYPVKANDYKIMPNHKYVKDPTVHFACSWDSTDKKYEDVNSEKAYLFVAVKNGLAAVEAAADDEYKQIATQITDNSWGALTSTDGKQIKVNDYAIYYQIANASATKSDYKVFEEFKITSELSNEANATLKMDDYNNKTIDVKAFAIQYDGFTDANDAWTNSGFASKL